MEKAYHNICHISIETKEFTTLLSGVRLFMWAMASHDYILKAHMNKRTLFNNVMVADS